MPIQHQDLASGRWGAFSFAEQMGHIGSEVSRAVHVRNDDARYWSALTRAFELLDLTIADPRLRGRLKEVVRVREVLADAALGGAEYGSKMEDLDRYFFQFASASRAVK
jgi:hypothetical protein